MLQRCTYLFLVSSSIVSSSKLGHHDGHDDHHRDHRELSPGFEMCGMPEPTVPEIAYFSQALDAWAVSNPERAGARDFSVRIPVHFHVITDGEKGNLTTDQRQNTIAQINNCFGPAGFQFDLVNTTFTDSRRWFKAYVISRKEMMMKRRLKQGGPETLNIYTKEPGMPFMEGMLGGYAYLPSLYCDSPVRDGVVLHYATAKNGEWESDGDIFCHEIGHWLGLLHTFQNGCEGAGDGVADTPAHEQSEERNCTQPRDTCGFDNQTDPLYNYMNYVLTECMSEFSAGQIRRMQMAYNAFRGPDRLNCTDAGGICFSPQATTVVEGKGQTAMKDIVVGDKALTAYGDYKTVYTMNHYHHTKPTKFLQIYTEMESNPLEISPKHMLFKKGDSHPVVASALNVGDFVETLYGPKEVINITTTVRNGMYNPITTDGTIVVDGIVASTYTSFLEDKSSSSKAHVEVAGYKIISVQTILDMMFAPYRTFCMSISLDLCNQHGEGKLPAVHYFATWFYDFWLQQNSVFQFVILCIHISFFAILSFVVSPEGICGIVAVFFGWIMIVVKYHSKYRQERSQVGGGK